MKIQTSLLMTAAVVAATFAPMARGQSLGEFARKERAKRSKEPIAVKVYTNDNIPHAASIGSTAPAEAAPSEAPAPPAGASEPPTPPASPEVEAEPAKAEAEQEKETQNKQKTRDYWQAKFKTAREAVAQAEERARLSADETALLQMSATRELDPQASSQLQAQLDANQAKAREQQAALEKAKKALDDLEQEFRASGAPEEWSKTD